MFLLRYYRLKSQSRLPEINLISGPERHTAAGVGRNINPAAVAEQGCAERTAVVEDAPLAGGGFEEDVGVGAGNARIGRVRRFREREFVVAEHPAHCIKDL